LNTDDDGVGNTLRQALE